MPASPTTKIVDFVPAYANAFRELNVEWLEKFFRVEPIDQEILGDPACRIIADGGAILFAKHADNIVGTVALKHQGSGVYELTKMAVTQHCQGAGIGRNLLEACIERYRALEGRMLYLESHSSLVAALALYESAGFEHAAPPEPSDYERADVYMIHRDSEKPPDGGL